jgi:hypothetical protein
MKSATLKWVCTGVAMLLLSGCAGVAEFARSHDRELVAMVAGLLDEINAGNLPRSEEGFAK